MYSPKQKCYEIDTKVISNDLFYKGRIKAVNSKDVVNF